MNLDQTKTPQQLAAEFLDAVKAMPSASTEAISFLQLTPEQSVIVDAAILADFDGCNHIVLAHRYRVSLAYVYRLVKQSRLQSVSLALRQVVGIEPEVVWATELPFDQEVPLSVLGAALQAVETAKATLLEEAHDPRSSSVAHRLLVAIAVLPPGHPAVLAANNSPFAATAPTESPPNTQALADSPPDPAGQ